jgi:5,6-dimethylbenzimidazole synthase
MPDESPDRDAALAAPRFDDAFRARLRELLVWRRDVRRFRRDALPPGAIERLIEVACLAPSVGLSQPWRFVIVNDAARRRAVRANFERSNAAALAEQGGDRAALYARLKLAGLDEAPAHVAVFADPETEQGHGLGRRTMPETVEYSVVAAIQTMWLAARAEGLGLGWVSILDPAEVAKALDVPATWTFVAYLCIGYPEAADDVPALAREGWERSRPVRDFIVER